MPTRIRAPARALRCWLVRSVALLACLGPFGCGSQPHAPSLQHEPVYQNSAEGFRFLAPENWALHAKSALPAGKFEKERLLVGYRRQPPEKPALLEVSRADLPESIDLMEQLGRPSYGATSWRLKTGPERLEVNGVAAQRASLSAVVAKDDLTREVVVFRKGEKVYFFTGLFPSKDARAREEIRRSVGSVIWKD